MTKILFCTKAQYLVYSHRCTRIVPCNLLQENNIISSKQMSRQIVPSDCYYLLKESNFTSTQEVNKNCSFGGGDIDISKIKSKHTYGLHYFGKSAFRFLIDDLYPYSSPINGSHLNLWLLTLIEKEFIMNDKNKGNKQSINRTMLHVPNLFT